MVKRGSHYICMLLIYLLIMPVLHTADVFAYFNADIRGHDSVPGFRRASSDVTIINVTAGIIGQSIDESQIKLITDPTRRFDCIFNNETTLHGCELMIPGNLAPGPHDYEVQLFNLDLSEAEPKQILTIVADNLPPDIHSFNLKRNGSEIDAEFRLSDRACEICNPQVCAGIGRVEILLNHQKVGEFFPETDSCVIPYNSTMLDIPPSPGTTTKTICIDAYDRLGQKTSECKEITMDFSPPQLINASIWLGSERLRFTKGEPIADVVLKAYITEESGLNISTLIADLSSLNAREEFSQIYNHIDMSDINRQRFEPSCIEESNTTYLCTWKNLLIYLPEGSSPKVRLSALDSFGNVMNDTYILPFVFDNTEPLVTGARTGIADDVSRFWVGRENNTIYVDLEETGAGFEDKNIALDFGSFGPQPFADDKEVIQANDCVAGWTCMFELVNVVKEYSSGTVLPVTVAIGSSDDAGNMVGGTTTLGFYYDNEAPEIISIENSSICPTAPDDIEITVTVSELYSGGVEAKVSAPDISADAFPIDARCEETETKGTWICDIVIGNLFTYYTEGEINLTLEDRAGNKETTTLYQEVCEAAPGVPPNVVRKVERVNLFPTEGIDRMVADKTPFPLFWQPAPKFQSGNAEIQDIKIDICTIEGGDVSDVYVLTPLNMEDTLFSTKISLSPGTLSVENESSTREYLNMNCNLSLTVRSGRKVYQQPEIEVVEFKVPLYSTIFGELNESMQDKLDDIDKKIKDVEGEISYFQSKWEWAGMFCSIAELIMKLLSVLQILKTVLYGVGWAVYAVVSAFSGTAAGESAGGNVYYWPCFWIDYLTSFFIANLWQVDSSFYMTYASIGYIPKAFCAWSTCRVTEGSSFLELVAHLGRTNSGKFSGRVGDVYTEGEDNYLSIEDLGEDIEVQDDIAIVVEGGSQKFSAYRSFPLAEKFGCFPAMVYGKQKERQVLCMKKNCYKNLVTAGFSPEICDRMHAARECLYVDGAFYKITGLSVLQDQIGGTLMYLLSQAPQTGLAIGARAAGCGYPWDTATATAEGWEYAQIGCGEAPNSALYWGWKAPVVCTPLIMTAMYLDVGDWLGFDDFRNVYFGSLGNPDYCEMDESE